MGEPRRATAETWANAEARAEIWLHRAAVGPLPLLTREPGWARVVEKAFPGLRAGAVARPPWGEGGLCRAVLRRLAWSGPGLSCAVLCRAVSRGAQRGSVVLCSRYTTYVAVEAAGGGRARKRNRRG